MAATAGCTLMNSGDSSGLQNRDEVRIGLVTATQSTLGKGMVRCAEAAVEDINDNGGIAGKDAKLFVGDTKADPQKGLTAYQKLRDNDNIDVLSGIWISEVGMTLLERIARDNMVTMATAMGTPQATKKVDENYEKYKYYFRSQVHTNQMVEWSKDYIQEYMLEQFDVNRVGLLVEDALWTEPYGAGLRDFFENETDVTLAYDERPATDTNDFSPLLQSAADSDVDALYTIFSHLSGTNFFQPWKQNQFDYLLDGFIATAGSFNYWKQTNGTSNYAASQLQAGMSAKSPEFYRRFIERQPDDDVVFPNPQTYDGIRILANAIGSAETLDPDELVAQLEETSHQGLNGLIEFHGKDEDHTHNLMMDKDHFYMRKVQWQGLDQTDPVTGGGYPYSIWPAHDIDADTSGVPTIEQGEYEVPPWVSQ
ncbi:ABC transporter substrate-binding protein [Natrinema marinum]|uniref:ABC transporter substrate-binding protein n=1 Tax=Natrinema marinum TaxID=2961598 RepID=UPI0020C90DC4|nr:ABC transporter substrate-binding protein [Natrinema marinum]